MWWFKKKMSSQHQIIIEYVSPFVNMCKKVGRLGRQFLLKKKDKEHFWVHSKFNKENSLIVNVSIHFFYSKNNVTLDKDYNNIENVDK